MLMTGFRTLAIGLALFSMFFGSGNLIFPLFVGQEVGDESLVAMLGFNFTAAVLPFLGVMTMVLFEGDYIRFFCKLSRPLGFLLVAVLLIFWVPLGSGPRCITLSYAAFRAALGDSVSLPIFSLVYSTVIYLMTYNRGRIIDILGYVLTPILISVLGYILFVGIFYSPSRLGAAPEETIQSLWFAIREGYYTMDLISAFFFSATIIDLLRYRNGERVPSRQIIPVALRSGFIGIGLLIVVYCGLIYISAANSTFLQSVNSPKDSLLPTLAIHLLGDKLGVLASVAIGFACITTSIALASVFSDFLRIHVLRDRITHGQALLFTTVISYAMSVQGFEVISKISSPAFELFYPVLLALILIVVPGEIKRRINRTN